jgi:uncharacterized repeat protein (TIGR01451 family)
MQYLYINQAKRLIVALALFTGGTQTALAVGTASGTVINNTATVDYQVGTDPRTASGSAPGIAVDNRVDVSVFNTDAGNNVNATPGSNDQVLTFTVTNTGNTTQGYILTTDVAAAAIPMGSIEIWLDTNGNGTWDGAGLDTLYVAGSNAFDLDPNGAVGADVETVFIVADTPAAAANGSIDDIRLVAQTTNAGTNTPTPDSGAPDPDPAVVDVVWADAAGSSSDAARDGQHSFAATFTVVSAALTATKTVAATTDEFGSGYAIPGAVVRYQIAIANTGPGTVDADTIVVSDPVPVNTRLCVSDVSPAPGCTAADLATFAAGTSGLTGVAFEYSNDGGTSWTHVPVADAQGADTNITNVRQAPTGAMNGTSSFDITFGVVIE